MQRILPALKIHTWGGLGSQLFAIALACDMSERFPKRRIQIVLHTGGVTRRQPEVKTLFPEYNYRLVDDYRPSIESRDSTSINSSLIPRTEIRILVIKLIKVLGLTVSFDNDLEYSRLKPWVISCRGHYSYRTISFSFLRELNQRIQNNSTDLNLSQSCTVHYRLGDLLTLVEKSPIPSDRILSALEQLVRTEDFDSLVIFSDSPQKAFDLFNGVVPLEVKSPVSDTIEVMANSIDSKFFIGTSSKISFWIAGIRAQIKNCPSLLPSNNSTQFEGLVGKRRDFISTYEVRN